MFDDSNSKDFLIGLFSRHLEGANIAFADGHVKWLQKNNAGEACLDLAGC
jgi:prepilin-type processing-associated H-X9-DG protein